MIGQPSGPPKLPTQSNTEKLLNLVFLSGSAPIASYPPSFILGPQRQTELDAESPSIFLSTDCVDLNHSLICRLGLYVNVTSIHWVVRERVADAGTSFVNEFTEVVFPTSSSREHLDIARTKLWPVAMFPGYRLESYISQVALVFLLDFGHTPTIRNLSFWRGGGYQCAGALALLLTRFLVIYLAFFVMTEQYSTPASVLRASAEVLRTEREG
ncbi:hypothetical protein B0H11DRAFT_1926562 [Mycena galericulata]|nr:hypothetical protein B0H11DRAFT_1926562 [Mycena galericulata]